MGGYGQVNADHCMNDHCSNQYPGPNAERRRNAASGQHPDRKGDGVIQQQNCGQQTNACIDFP
jgi:hypothetical protein